jgi:hypothetical protein
MYYEQVGSSRDRFGDDAFARIDRKCDVSNLAATCIDLESVLA